MKTPYPLRLKRSTLLRRLLTLLCSLHFSVFLTNPAMSAILNWNGGDGDWDTITPNWNFGALWNNSTPDNALFKTGGNTISLTMNITAGSVTFQTMDDSSLTSSSSQSLSFNSFTNTNLLSLRGSIALNANASNAMSVGNKVFYDTSSLNANAQNAVNGANLAFYDSSVLNANAPSALSDGAQAFYNSAVLNANLKSTVSGGMQTFGGNSQLNASASSIIGGTQNFNVNSSLNANGAKAVAGGTQNFDGTSTLNALTTDAVVGGKQNFYFTSKLNANAANAVSSNANITLYESSSIEVNTVNALSSTATINFDNSLGGVGGTLRLNGNNTTIGQINSSNQAGVIENSSSVAATLAVSGNFDSNFTGLIQDGGTGILNLTKAGSGTLILTGSNTYTGNTIVNAGTLLVNNPNGSGTGLGAVNVGTGGTLGGNGYIAGPTSVQGTLEPGTQSNNLTFGNSLTLASTSNTIMRIDGLNSFNHITVEENLLMNGTLTVMFENGYMPNVSQGPVSFDLFDWLAQNGQFNFVNITGLDAGWSWDDSQLYTDGIITVVPEPSTGILLLLSMVGGLVILQYRQTKKLKNVV